jgi:glucokinase
VINDLEAAAAGLHGLPAGMRVTLHPGSPDPAGNAALIAPGTGLGEAGLFHDGRRHRPFATEGGHASFAPRGPRQRNLLRHLARRHGHVSWERVVSGPGLVAIYEFLLRRDPAPEPEWLAEARRRGDAAAIISAAGIDGRSATCRQALDLFVDCLGSETGNLALKVMATGGVFIAGGIAPKILPRLRDGRLVRAFLAKGRMLPLLAAMPVHVVLEPRLALVGAARQAVAAA